MQWLGQGYEVVATVACLFCWWSSQRICINLLCCKKHSNNNKHTMKIKIKEARCKRRDKAFASLIRLCRTASRGAARHFARNAQFCVSLRVFSLVFFCFCCYLLCFLMTPSLGAPRRSWVKFAAWNLHKRW